MNSINLAPVIISVVGHRDPDPNCLSALKSIFAADLKLLSNQLPHTPIYLLNGLASGMDLEAAEVFCDVLLKNQSSSANRLIPVFPKLRDTYRSELSSASDMEHFDHLINSYANNIYLDPSSCQDLSVATIPNANRLSSESSECYVRQSLFLVKNSSLIFAFNDGSINGKVGGTSHSVLLAKKEVYSWYINSDELNSDHEPTGVVEYYTPRISRLSIQGEAFESRYWLDSNSKANIVELLDGHKSVDTFNAKYLSSDKLSFSLAEFADWKATQYKKIYTLGIFCLLFAGLIIALSLARPLWQILGLSSIYASIFFFPSFQSNFRENFISYRCLAESLSVVRHWHLFKINRDPSDFFHTSLHHDLVWVRMVMRSQRVIRLVERKSEHVEFDQDLYLFKVEIEGQLTWLNSTVNIQGRKDKYLRIGLIMILILGCISSALLFIAVDKTLFKEVVDWSTEFFMAALVILIAYRELLGFTEINIRYQRSIIQLSRSLKSIGLAESAASLDEMGFATERIKRAIQAIGIEKMAELNDWVSDQLKRSYRP